MSNPTTLSQDTAFDLLSNERRRLALQYLEEHGGPVSIGELATEVAAMENDIPADEVDAQQRKRTYVSLYQTHVPKLAKANAVDYDSDEGIVELTPETRMVTSYLSPRGTDEPWPWFYLGLSAVGLPAYLLALYYDPVSHIQVGLVVLVLFAIVSAAHFWYARGRHSVTIDIGA